MSTETSRAARVDALEDEHWWFVATRELVTACVRAAQPAPARVLDVGCGTGRVLGALAGYERVGVDADPEAVEIARRRAGDGCRFEVADARALPLEDSWADAAICLDVLSDEGVGDPSAALRELRRVVRPGGLALLQLPAHPRLRSGHDRAARIAERHDAGSVRRLLAAGGLVPERITHRVTLLFPIAAARRLAMRRGAASDVGPVPAPLNAALLAVTRAESRAILRGANLPFGLSLLVWARPEAG